MAKAKAAKRTTAVSPNEIPLTDAERFAPTPGVTSETWYPQAIYREGDFREWLSEMPKPMIVPDEPAELEGTIIIADVARHTVTYKKKTVSFNSAKRQWQFMLTMLDSCENGISGADLLTRVWPGEVVGPNNLAQQSAVINKKLLPLRLTVKADNRGLWRLVRSGMKPA